MRKTRVEPSAHVRIYSKDDFSCGEMRKTRVEPSPPITEEPESKDDFCCEEMRKTGAQIFKEPKNRFQGTNSAGYAAWRDGTITLFLLGS